MLLIAGYAKRGAEERYVNPPGTTALHHAACEQDLSKAQALAKRGYSIDAQNERGETPLAYAIKCAKRPIGANIELVTFLLSSGANPNARDFRNGVTVLQTAADHGDAPAIRALVLHGAKVDFVSDIGSPTALSRAVSSHSFESVRELIEAGADPNKQRYVRKALDTWGVCDNAFQQDPGYDNSASVQYHEREFPEQIRTVELLIQAGAIVSEFDLWLADRRCKDGGWDRGKNRLAEHVRQSHSAKIMACPDRHRVQSSVPECSFNY